MISKHFVLGFCAVMMIPLASCVLIVSSDIRFGPPEVELSCGAMPVIALTPIPDVPVISATDLRNRDRSDTIMVNKIKELRDWAQHTQQAIDQSRTQHERTCRRL